MAMETIHECPPGDEALTPCCGRSPFQLPRTDRMTQESTLVTCSNTPQRPEPETEESQR